MDRKPEKSTIFQSISAAFMILIMHVLLVGTIGALIFFFYGIVNHPAWVGLGIVILCAGVFWVYRRIKADSKVLKDFAGESLKGKNVEISFLGGMANFKVTDAQTDNKQILYDTPNQPRQLAAPDSANKVSITELARLYEKELITLDEYRKAKQELFR